jgi:16S rRNA (uracil1498-N3)-methyltransferase
MALRRFFVGPEMFSQNPIVIDGDLFHHIKEVCRFSQGDEFELLPGDGSARKVRVQDAGKKTITVVEVGRRPLPEPSKPRIHLALSVPKFPKVDWIVEKCVELGVHTIVPFVSDYSFIREQKELSVNKVSRWQKLITAATQQSGRGDLMKLEPVTSLEALLKEFNRMKGVVGLFPYEGASQQDLREAIVQLKERTFEDLWVFVGSEGGFSPREVELFSQVGLPPVSMGEQILRVETACVALVSVLQYELRGQYGSI